MLDALFRRLDVRYRVWLNPHADLLQAFAIYFDDRGYARRTIQDSVRALEHFDCWLCSRRLSLRAATPGLVRSFLQEHLPDCKCPSPSPTSLVPVRAALNGFLKFLRAHNLGQTKPTQIDSVLEQYRSYLCNTGGLSENTCRIRLRYLRKFLHGKFGPGRLRWDTLTPNDVIAFVTEYAQAGKRVSAQGAADSLRSFFRFLRVQGCCKPSLLTAVPRIPDWRLARLPKTMTEKQLHEFLAAFDCSTPMGRRDQAMALCQVELGLRASEVAGLRLEDIDWRKATLRIEATKANRARELPLPARVGQALADYLRRDRPATCSRTVFVRHRLRHGTPVTTEVVRAAMRRAYVKVQGCERWTGTHVLRHTAATGMLRRGADLKKIADVLGHRSINTTVIYAKVDLPALAAVALPWPEVQP